MHDCPGSEGGVKVLLVDDDVELCDLLQEYLSPEGFQVTTSHSGPDGVAKALSGDFSLVILDVMLPDLGGLDVLRQIRRTSQMPVLMLTARGDGVDRVVGLELGADDYVPKPCSARELLARMRALLRRRVEAPLPRRPRMVRVGDIELDPGSRTVRQRGEPVVLTSVEFDLLAYLLEQAGQVVRRNELAQQILGRSWSPADRSIDVHVSRLRGKLGQSPDGCERIKSVRGVGYLYSFAHEN